ncbi:hypothetical protein [Niastella populi]|uniref:Uncharacterized protein n=1 Tax=Niastella populi TaxID=550983 RepID=A0A1V9G827_9BACT|nr:hypothetical protein [Niastella populi]OQP66720.1 hypothetical protein A4R26_13185 [Niastella populi]
MSRVNILTVITVIFIMALFNERAWAQNASNAQNRFYAMNVKKIDSFNLFLRTWCDSVKPVTITDASFQQDKENIRYVSKLYNANMSYKDFLREADKNDLVRSQFRRVGLVNLYEYKIDEQLGYLAIDIWLTVMDEKIIYKKFVIRNLAKRECLSGNVTVPFFDYVYFKRLVNEVHFPIEGCANCDSLVVDTLYGSLFNEVAQKYPNYNFIPEVANERLKDRIFEATYLDDSYYHNNIVPELFVLLVNLKEYEAITNLLYSPNHLMAVNAYEALVYLRSTRTLEINAQQEEKMNSIAAGKTEIPVYCGRDCKPENYPYSTLKISERNIYDKYEAALR